MEQAVSRQGRRAGKTGTEWNEQQGKETRRGNRSGYCYSQLRFAKLAPGDEFWSLMTRVQIPGVPFTYCVTMCELLDLSELDFAYQQNSTYFPGLAMDGHSMRRQPCDP